MQGQEQNETRFVDRVIASKAQTKTPAVNEPVAIVAIGGIVANIYHTPDERRGDYLIEFERHFKDGTDMVASSRFAEADMTTLRRVATLASDKVAELRKPARGNSR